MFSLFKKRKSRQMKSGKWLTVVYKTEHNDTIVNTFHGSTHSDCWQQAIEFEKLNDLTTVWSAKSYH